MAEQIDFKSRAEAELRQMRDHCQRGVVGEEIKKIRESLTQGNLSLADIGTTEEELQLCFKTGHKDSAKSWLRMAREPRDVHDVSLAIANVRSRISEANLTLADVDTSEKELSDLLSPPKPVQGWHRLFRRAAK
jgi:hypothetical protein